MPGEEEGVSADADAFKPALDAGFKRLGQRSVYRAARLSDDIRQGEDEGIGG